MKKQVLIRGVTPNGSKIERLLCPKTEKLKIATFKAQLKELECVITENSVVDYPQELLNLLDVKTFH